MKAAQIRVFGGILALVAGFSSPSSAQNTSAPTSPAPVERRDSAVDAASNLIGKALFLRCFCSENNLSFDTQGQPQGNIKTTDWTLAGVNVTKVSRKSPTELELEGVRVAIRFAPDRREFDRKPQNDDKIKIQLADPGDASAFTHELSAIFSEGLDRRLQHAMPPYWQHYFDPQTPWPQDDLTGATLYVAGNATRIPGATPAGEGLVPVTATKRASAAYTAQAMRDRVQGSIDLRIVVDATGDMHHVAIEQPLGYGLDARAVESLAKWKFSAAKLAGKPVPAYTLIRPEFTVVDIPQ